MKTIATWIVLIIVLGLGIAYLWDKPVPTSMQTATTTTSGDTGLHNEVSYFCTGGEIDVLYTDNQVVLNLPDSRSVTLTQVRSGSGTRYEANTFLFTSKGNNATLTENGIVTFSNCIAGNISASGAGTGFAAFEGLGHTFSLVYPTAFVLSGVEDGYTTQWRTNATTSGLVLAHITAPKSFMPGTNFSEAKLTVGVSSDPSAITMCTAATNGEKASGTTMINGQTFSKFVLSDAGAGNLYDTTSYRTIRDGDCYSVEYTIHSTQIANYPPELGIKQFDKAKIQNALESIVKSFTFLVNSD